MECVPSLQVYGSIVAGRYSNQHVLPLAHMAVSVVCVGTSSLYIL